MLPRFEEVGRLRPVSLLAPRGVTVDLAPDGGAVDEPAGAVAPYLAVVGDLAPGARQARVGYGRGDVGLAARLEHDRVGLEVRTPAGSTRHASRRHGRTSGADALAVTLTGDQLTAFVREGGRWVIRAVTDLPAGTGPRSDAELAALRVRASGRLTRLQAGAFGQLGLRDLHLATYADGGPVRLGDDADGELVLTATHAGPGRFATGHTGVWTYASATGSLTHRTDLFVRRPPGGGGPRGVYGDHATHLVRDGTDWLMATSTWGDFDGRDVRLVTARTDADLLTGTHVLDAVPLPVPLDAAGVWDPHLLHHDGEWWLALVAARRFFDFRPALCRGRDLDALRLVGVDESRRATEGTVLVRLDDGWRLLASDGRDNARGRRERYGVYDLTMRRVGELDAPYPTNIPWPNLVRDGDGWLMLTFDGTAYDHGRRGVPVFGSHGDVVVMRTVRPR